MRLLKLDLTDQGVTLAQIEHGSGVVSEVTFTTVTRDEITVAYPDRDISSDEPMSIGEVRAVISAVIAFERAARFPVSVDD